MVQQEVSGSNLALISEGHCLEECKDQEFVFFLGDHQSLTAGAKEHLPDGCGEADYSCFDE